MKINLKLATFFWGIMYICTVGITLTLTSPWDAILFSTVLVTVCIFQVYFHLLLLLPRYFESKKYVKYGFTSALLIGFVALFRILIQLNVSSGQDTGVLSWLKAEEMKWLWFIGMLLAHGGVHLITLVFRMIIEWEESQRIKSEMKSNQLEAELKFLRLQLNPHFLFNTLNNIYTLAYLKKDNAAPMIMKLSESMRYMLSEANHKEVALEKEVQFLNNYLELSRLKSPQFSKIQLECKGVKGYHKIAPLLLISFIENIIKHSDLEANPEGNASIFLQVSGDDVLTLKTENSKSTANTQVVSTGIGIQNIKKRLALLYPEHTLNVDDQADTFRVHLTFKLTTHELHYSG